MPRKLSRRLYTGGGLATNRADRADRADRVERSSARLSRDRVSRGVRSRTLSWGGDSSLSCCCSNAVCVWPLRVTRAIAHVADDLGIHRERFCASAHAEADQG